MNKKNVDEISRELIKKHKQVVVLIYARVSSEQQARDGHGLDAQVQRCVEFATSKGFITNGELSFRDVVSGGNDHVDRVALTALFAHIDANPTTAFVFAVDDISRIARDVVVHARIRTSLRERGVEVISPNFNFDETEEGEMVENMMASMSQYQRRSNRRTVVQKIRARLMDGYWSFAPKTGYKMVKDLRHGKLAVPCEKWLTVLTAVLEGFANGTFVRKIDACIYIAQHGLWNKQSPDKYIDKLTVILTDPFYAGFIEYVGFRSKNKGRKKNHKPVDWDVTRRIGKHKGYITLEVFELIQKRLQKEAHTKRVRMDITPEFPLRGLVSCSECGEPLTGATTTKPNKPDHKGNPYYFCQGKGCSLRKKSIRKAVMEGEFEELLKRNTLKDEVDVVLATIYDRVWNEEMLTFQKQSALIKNKKKELGVRIKELTSMVILAKSPTVKGAYESQIEELADEIDKLGEGLPSEMDNSVPYRTALEKSRLMLKSPYEVWEVLNVFDKQRLFYFIFDEKIPYQRGVGYRTEKSPNAIRLFGDFAGVKPRDVEMAGANPRPAEKSVKVYVRRLSH